MDSSTLLDYALFQLTPTRTRCDLVVYASGKSEKLASGLLEPFLSHLRSAKDQISRGGYSVELRPPPTANPSWFTKSTLQRFVRFVSTPEVLERFVTIEREIEQIESSVQSKDTLHTETEAVDGTSKILAASSKLRGESNGATATEENSKVRLQRVLETRKAVLRKEQTMAYCRALVSGFEMDTMDALLRFADAFGASRLREACLNFTKLCNKKSDDYLWMDELAAIQASPAEFSLQGTSGVILADEDGDLGQNISIDLTNAILSGGKQIRSIDASVSDSTLSHGSLEVGQDTASAPVGQLPPTNEKSQVPMFWPNHHPQYVQNFQGPGFQQMPPYQGFPFPGMHAGPHYHPGNTQWPPNREDSVFYRDKEPTDRRRPLTSSRNKGLSSQGKELENSSSGSGSDSDELLEHEKKHYSEEQHKKKNVKKASRKVVIRNINYIASKRDAENRDTSDDYSSNGDDVIDGDSLRQHVQDVVGSLDRRHKTAARPKRHDRRKHTSVVKDANGDANRDTVNAGETLNGSWDAFQSLLLRDKDSPKGSVEPPSLHFEEENCTARSFGEEMLQEGEILRQQAVSTDSFVVTGREATNDRNTLTETFGPSENILPIMKKSENTYEELLFSHRIEGPQNYSRAIAPDPPAETSITKLTKEGDWFPGNHANVSPNRDESINPKMFSGDYDASLSGVGRHTVEEKKEVFVDDSFMIQDRSAANEGGESQLTTDISMVTDIIGASQLEDSIVEIPQSKSFSVHEPDDLYMVLDRSSTHEYSAAPWTPEMDYGNDISQTESNKRKNVETVDCADHKPVSNGKATNGINGGAPKGKVSSREAKSKALGGSMTKQSSGISSRSKKPTLGSNASTLKNKSEKEEETKRKMEELMIQRQKRIAERSAARGSGPATSKKTLLGNKTATSSKSEKHKHQSPNPEEKKLPKPMNSSTIDRLAAPRKIHEVSSAQLKSSQPKKTASKSNSVIDAALKSSVKKPKALDQKGGPKNSNGSPSSVSDNGGNKDQRDISGALPVEVNPAKATQSSVGVDDSNHAKEINDASSVEKDATQSNSQMNGKSTGRNSSVATETAQQDHLEADDGEMSKASTTLCEQKAMPNHVEIIPGRVTVDPLPPPAHEEEASSVCEEGTASECIPASPEITVIEMSTPPPSNGMNHDQELIPSRKKWNDDESSLKAAKGFKKLLLFGRKSH